MHTELFVAYVLRCLPGLVVALLLLLLMPRRLAELRLFVYVLAFFLLRDAMTPIGLWTLGVEGWFWLRVIDDPVLVVIVGGGCVAIVIAMNRADPALAEVVVWWKGGRIEGIATALAAAFVVALPVLLLQWNIPVAERGGPVRAGFLPVLLGFCLLVNLYEETLFRGYLQGLVVRHTSEVRAALISGLAFGLGHVFLASTVTDLGAPLIGFVVWEGTVAGLVRLRHGVFASTVTHGGGIFLIMCAGAV